MIDNSLRVKLSVIFQTGSSLTESEKLMSPIVDLGRMCITSFISLSWICNDGNFRRNSSVVATSGYCPSSWIFDRRRCCPLSIEVVYVRLAM